MPVNSSVGFGLHRGLWGYQWDCCWEEGLEFVLYSYSLVELMGDDWFLYGKKGSIEYNADLNHGTPAAAVL